MLFSGTAERQDINDANSGSNLNQNTISVNEQANQNATHGSLPKRNTLNEPVLAAPVNLNAAKDNTRGRMPVDDPGIAPDAVTCKATVHGEALPSEEDTTSGGPLRKFSRQFSRDSQRSGNTSQSVLFFQYA